MSTGAHGGQAELEIQGDMSCTTWVLGIEPTSSVKAVPPLVTE